MNEEQLDVLQSVPRLMEPVSVVGLFLNDFVSAFPQVPPEKVNDIVNYLVDNGYVSYEDPTSAFGLCVTGVTAKGWQALEA